MKNSRFWGRITYAITYCVVNDTGIARQNAQLLARQILPHEIISSVSRCFSVFLPVSLSSCSAGLGRCCMEFGVSLCVMVSQLVSNHDYIRDYIRGCR